MAFVTVREAALEAIVSSFQALSIGSPQGDPYTIQFDYVLRSPLNDESWKKRLTLGIYDTAEDVKDGANRRDCVLNVVLEFHRVLDTGEAGSAAATEILGNIERRIGEDRTFGGTVIDTVEARNELYIENENQRQLHGALWLSLHYYTAANDPRVKAF
jgi:hypothetical protein